MSNSQIDEWYELGRKNGADGPSLLGTGGALRRALPFLGEAFLFYTVIPTWSAIIAGLKRCSWLLESPA